MPVADKWERRYQQANLPVDACALLQQQQARVPTSGRALDLACGLGGNATEEASLVAAIIASAEAHTAFSARLGDCPRCAPPPPPPPPGPAGGALLLGASLGLNALLLLLLAARWLLGRKEKRE